MANPVFTPVHLNPRRDELIALNIEYMDWVAAGIERDFGLRFEGATGLPVAAYVPRVIDAICGEPPPRGIFYLVDIDGPLAAMGGLRCVRDGVAEIKRIYVRPAQRGVGLGQAVLGRLLDDARSFGYRQVCLDSAPFMAAAQRVYRAFGFVDCEAYAGTEVPLPLQARWCFMQRTL